MKNAKKQINASVQRAVWRQSGCLPCGQFSGNLEVHLPSHFSEPTPERQVAKTLAAMHNSAVDNEEGN